jgi:hypothetical protein
LPAQSLTYSIVGGADAAKFSIDAVSGVLRFRLGNPSSKFRLTPISTTSIRSPSGVSDGTGSPTRTQPSRVQRRSLLTRVPVVTSAILAVNEGQTVSLSGVNFSIPPIPDKRRALFYTLSGSIHRLALLPVDDRARHLGL